MANEVTISVWCISEVEELVSEMNKSLKNLGFPELEQITDPDKSGGSRKSGFTAYSACFRSVRESDGVHFPTEFFASHFIDIAVSLRVEDGGIVIENDEDASTHSMMFPAKGMQLNRKALEFGVLYVKEN